MRASGMLTAAVADALEQTFGCYFHQDWPAEFATEAQAFAKMRNEVTTEVRALAAEGIDQLLHSQADDSTLSGLLRD